MNRLFEKLRDLPSRILRQERAKLKTQSGRGSHIDYTKFIILGRSRSGSNFLRGLLNSHRNVVCYGELFQHDRAISWGLSNRTESPALLQLFRDDAVRFVEEEIFGPAPKSVAAVGFKLFYYHAHTAQWQPVWGYLAAQPSLKVLHIKRDNLLAVHLSRKRAAMTDRWVNTSGTREEYAPITLDYAECLADFVQTRQWEEEYARFFDHQHMLEVHYETLVYDSVGEMARVQRFLGLTPQTLTPETFRQSDSSLRASIANYAELKAQFNGSPWQAFFEE